MRNTLLILALLLSSFLAQAQEMSGIHLPKTAHYFGSFSRDKGVRTHEFVLENTGTDPLLIQRVKATCGCTVAEWTKTPIAPGESGTVMVKFDPKKFSGYFSKKVSVYTNRSSQAISLQISGRIIVNNRIKDDFSFFLGDLKTDKENIDFTQEETHGSASLQSDSATQDMRFINIMRDTIWIRPLDVPKGLRVTPSCELLAPGGNCRLTFTYYPPKRRKKKDSPTLEVPIEIRRSVKTEVRKVEVRVF
ncbi:MAG: DUF1573 domain-containing protein [Mangrovibacterium sp.]